MFIKDFQVLINKNNKKLDSLSTEDLSMIFNFKNCCYKNSKTYHYQSDVVIKRINIVILVQNYVFDIVFNAITVISAAYTNFKFGRNQSEK